jgi:hypothetical protein
MAEVLDVDRSSVLSYLRRLTAKQFAELFYDAVEGKHPWPGEERTSDVRLVLGYASRDLDADNPDAPWQLSLVCPVPDEKWVDDAPVCQHGSHCGHDTISWAKPSVCPICGGEVYGT